MVELTLRWEKYGLGQGLHNMMVSQELVDVTILCQGEFIQAHKSVLAACSQQFREIFKTVPDKNPVIVLKGVDSVHLKNLLSFMYLGEVTVEQDGLADFITTADELGVSALSTKSRGKAEQRPPPELSPAPAPEAGHSFQTRLNTETCGLANTSLPDEENLKSNNSSADMACDDQQFKEEYDDDVVIEEWDADAMDDPSDNVSSQETFIPQPTEEFQVPDVNRVSMCATDDPGPSTSQASQWVLDPSPTVSLKASAHQAKTSPDTPEQTPSPQNPPPTRQRPPALEPPPAQQPQASTSKGSRGNRDEPGSLVNSTSRFLQSHKRTNSGFQTKNNDSEHKCATCDKVFGTKINLNRHINNLHSALASAVCNFCLKVFKNHNSMLAHRITFHTGPRVGEVHTCKTCGKNLSSRRALRLHEHKLH